MSNNRPVARARLTLRLFCRGVFLGLLSLAITIATMSFLTACKCVEYSVHETVKHPVRKSDDTELPSDTKIIYPSIDTKPQPSTNDLPTIPIPGDKKDN